MMENNIIQAFNEMNDTEYETIEEIQKHFSTAEILQSWLEYKGIYGYTAKILHVLEILQNKE